MRYFKIVLACFGFIFAVVGITAGVLFLTGKFDKEVIQPEDIAFEITEKLTEDDFEVVVNTTTENVTEKDVTLSLTNQTESDGMISDGVITVPKVVKLGKPFTVKVNKTHYAGMTEEWNVGGTSIIRAKSTNPLIQEATPLTVEVDVPVHSLAVDLVTTTGTKIGTVSARDLKNYMRTLAEGDEDKKVVELAVGSVVRLQPVFTPARSAKTTKGEQRKVLFEIPTAWKGIHIDFVDGENDLVEVLRQTTVEDIKINAYCFRTSADEYEAQSQGYSDEELITIMNSNGVSGESAQIFGTNQKITSFTSSTNNEYMTLAINSPMTLIANGTGDNAFNLGLGLASDAGVAKLEDKIAVIKLFAYWQNDLGEWEDAGDKLMIVGQTSSNRANGVKAKINKNDANLSSWRVVASETGKFKIVANLSYEYYSSSSSVPTVINFDIDFANILVSDPISSDVAWKNTLPAIKTLVVLDGETAAEKYYPTINLADYVDIKNPNATYKVVRFFAYSTEGLNLSNIINCSLYSGSFAVPDSSYQYEVFEIPNGILTAKDVGSFRIFFATVVSDYMGNPKIQFGEYLFESFSNTNTINVVKSLKQLDASMTVNEQEEGKDYNKNTDENTRDYIFHVRQQDEKVFTLSLFVSDIEIFERDYADGKISIDFLLGGQKSNILSLTGDYTIEVDEKRIDFQVSVNSLPNNDQPTLECKITYELDHRLDKFVSNNGNKVQIKVLNGFAQEIVFDAVKDAYPKNSEKNPIQVEIKFNAGSDNVATNIEYGITLNGQNLILEDLSKVTINEEALNKSYTLSSNKPAVIAVEDAENGPKLSILGATEDEDVIITATAADGSGLSTNLYFKVLASLQITLTPNESEITMDGYQGSQMNFRTYFDAKAGDIDLNNLLEYSVPIENSDKFVFADDTLKVISTLGRDASLQLYITSEFGFTKVVPIRIVSTITSMSTYANNDQGLDDEDFVARGETPPTERGTRVYAENSREISFVLTQEKPTSTKISISVDDFELPKNGGIQSIAYNNGILTVCFDAVSQITEKTIVFKKNFSENDEYAFVYTMKFLVFPNIKASLVSSVGSENNPANYISGETVVYDAKNNSNGLIKLERILGSNIISEHATLEAKINGEWVTLSSNSGAFTLPTSFRATEGSFVEIRITYDGCVLSPIRLFLKPFFDESTLLDAKVLYDGKLYVPFIATENNSIALSQAEGVVYTIINATSEQYLRIRANQIEKLDRLYTKIITSEKLRIENGNGVTELPILILPLKYPFVVYDSIENAESEETYRNVDLKQVIESESFYDTLEAGSEESIDLKSKILVDGLESGGALVSVTNADGSANNYVNYDNQNLTISANSVGKDQIIYVNVKCGAEFEEAFEFVYRIKVTANQQIKVFYPYIEYNEEYNVDNAYEYLYFGSKNQISVDLMEEFDVEKTPNKKLLEELFPTTNGQAYARRFVVVREKDGKLIPVEYKDLHFEIASVGIGKAVIPADQVSNYVTINEKTTTNGVLQSANMFVNRGQSVETINIRIRAFTSSGAEAYYRFQVNDKPISYTTYYKNQKIDYNDFSVASDGASEINLNENVDVRVGENPQQPVSPNEYKFYLIVHEKLGTDYSQFITLSGGIIQISTLVNDVETTVVIYNNKGEISRFNLVLKCTIDHEIISTTVNDEGIFDIGESVDFFNATSADGNYSMQEITTRLYVKNYLNGTELGTPTPNNLFVNVGGYSIKDISKQYKQYVLIDNLKVYAENLMETWKGVFYLGANAKYEVLTEGEKSYIRYNGSVIEVEQKDGKSVVNIPLQSITDNETVEYVVTTDADDKTQYVIIPHLKFSNGNDTRDYVLYDEVFHETETDENKKYTNEPFDINRKGNYTTYINAYVNGYIRYKVDRGVDSNGETELKVAILRLTHNNVSYIAQVDKEHYDHEYITIDNEKHYFTRFYTITYDGIAKNEQGEQGKDVLNVPRVRYMLEKGETSIDLSKIIFYTQEGISVDDVLTLGGTNYISDMFKFYIDDGSEEGSEIEFIKEDDKDTWKISSTDFSPINIMIKDTTGKYVVGRLTILPTVETSTSETENNKTIFIEAGDTTKVDYTITADAINVDSYAGAMSPVNEDKPFTGTITTDHPGWTSYVYSSSSEEYGQDFDENNGTISGLFGKAPWGKITVEAKLQYKNNSATLMTTLPFATWKNEILGEYSDFVNSYAELNAILGSDYRINIASSGNVNGETGEITDVAYGETITISLEAKCDKCGEWAVVGKEHTHWLEDGSEQITDISIFSDEQKETLSQNKTVEIIDENDQAKKYVYALTAGSTLQRVTSEDGTPGTWTLTETITKTTHVEETVKFEFRKSIQNPTTGEDVEVVITDGEKTVATDSLDLSTGYTTLAKALFGESATTILGYESWNVLLADCNVEFAGYDTNTKTFGGQKEINIALITEQAKHTGTFYIVNQEYDKSTLHGIGNLSNIGYSLKDYVNYFDENGKQQEEKQDIGSVVYVGTVTEGTGDNATQKPIWVYPMATTKTLKSDAIIDADGRTLEQLIADLWFNDITGSKGNITYSGVTRDIGNIPLVSAAGLLNSTDPFNTITIYQNGYAIGNINIYLEDYTDDNTAEEWKICSSSHISTEESKTYVISSTTSDATIEFAVEDNCLTTILTKTVEGKKEVTYITQNAKMDISNKYLFDNGLLLEWDDKDKEIVLSMVNKESKIEFAFNGVQFAINDIKCLKIYSKEMKELPKIYYFEGLEDATLQPENSKFNGDSKTYKAEKTGDAVVYKDKIEKNMFNFDKWEYSASYVNENGKTIQAIIDGKLIKIVGLSETNKQIKIIVSGISEVGGDYTFVVDLSQNPAVTIIGGNENITSPDTPYDGGVITGGQVKDIDLGDIFKINAKENPVEIKNYEGSTDEKSLLQVLYDNLYLYYLVGKLDEYTSNVFKITKDENSGQNIISIIFTGAEEQEFIIENDGNGNFSLVDKDGNAVDGDFVLELNKNLYEFSAKIVDEPEENGSNGEGESTAESGEQSGNEGESPDEGGEQPTTIKVLKITITPVFTYKYQVESNIKLINIDDTDFAETGKLKVVGGEIITESVVKLRFSVLRGKGTNGEAKEVAFAYYSLSLKPSVGAVVSYPTISTSTKDKKGNFIQDKQTTEYFYAGAGDFDIKAKSAISKGSEQGRMKITQYAYGTATVTDKEETISNACVATYLGKNYSKDNLTIIKIGDTDVTDAGLVTTGKIDGNGMEAEVKFNNKTYKILVYIPSELEISYTASSSQNIIKEIKTENGKEIYGAGCTTKTDSVSGKFKFEFGSDVNVSEAEVVISAQATIDKKYTYTFAQYTFTVCKNPVISTLITTEEGHLDENGAEILPINGGDDLAPFNIARGYVEIDGTKYEVTKNNKQYEVVVGSDTYIVENGQITIGADEDAKTYKVVYYNVINNSPRLQFLYNNLILSSDYNGEFEGKGVNVDYKAKINNYQISQKSATDKEIKYVEFTFAGQKVLGNYSYRTIWDYRINPTLDSHTIEGNYINPNEENKELLNYYYLEAGKAYNIIETFGLTKYFSVESLNEIFDLYISDAVGSEDGVKNYAGVKLTADGQSINILGAPEGGMNFRIKFKPYDVENDEAEIVVGITILPSIEIVVNYKTETIYENDPYAYGLITYNQAKSAYSLAANARGTDFTIQRNGVTADVVEGEYTFEIVEGTDATLNAKIIQQGDTATLTVTPPKLNAKRVVIKISDRYGYYQYLRYVIGAETQVVISSNDITFTTGGNIEWESNQFPISFKKEDEETIQLASFYEAEIEDATKDNTSDNFGSDSSLKIDTNGKKLYGVQLGSVITMKNAVKDDSGNDFSNWTYVQKRSTGVIFTSTSFQDKQIANQKEYIYLYLVTRNEIGKLTKITRTITQGQTKIAEDSITQATDGEWKFVDKDTTGKEKVDENGNKTYDTRFVLTEIRNDVYYIPYNGKNPISYDVYKLIAKSGDNDKVLKSFSNYKKQIVEGIVEGAVTKLESSCINTTTGAFTPSKKDTSSYYDTYVIKLYSSQNSSDANPDATMTFKILEVEWSDNLYYASRKNPSDHYTFDYEIKINGEGDSIVEGKNIKNIGNAQYGSASSLNSTLKITIKNGEGDILDYVDIGILLKFGIYPEVKQTVSGQISYDYVGRDDDIRFIVVNKSINLTGNPQPTGWTSNYYTILGDESSDSELKDATRVDKMDNGTFAAADDGTFIAGDKKCSYDGNTRVLSLIAELSGDKAELNNIRYTYAEADAKLTIGYKEVTLDANNTYVDDVTGITYQVKNNKLYVSKKVDNTGSVIINNKKYVVTTNGDTSTISYETLYESVFIVWKKDNSPSYWAQWNYKVVDKFNQVTTGDPLEAQDGNIKVKLDWTETKDGVTYRFNANTLQLLKTEGNSTKELGKAEWVSELSGNRYEITIMTTKDEQAITGRYKIVLNDEGKMAFSFISGEVDDVITSLALEEELKDNSSWVDKITLTGLDEAETNLRVAENIKIKVNGSESDSDDKYTISDESGLLGKTMNIEIVYTKGIGSVKDPIEVTLLFNGKNVKVTFEHFDPTKSNQQNS